MLSQSTAGVGPKTRFQVTLRMLLLLIGIAGILVGWYADHQSLMKEISDLKGPGVVRVYALRQAKAADVLVPLRELMSKQIQNKTVNMAVDQTTNSLLASGKTDALDMIEAVLLRLDVQPIAESGVSGGAEDTFSN